MSPRQNVIRQALVGGPKTSRQLVPYLKKYIPPQVARRHYFQLHRTRTKKTNEVSEQIDIGYLLFVFAIVNSMQRRKYIRRVGQSGKYKSGVLSTWELTERGKHSKVIGRERLF